MLDKFIPQTKGRQLFWDIVKGITILLVILGHQLQFSSGAIGNKSGVFFDNPIFKFIYSFHMPLFMLISGYFFYYSLNKYNAKELFKKKIYQLLIPITTVTVITCVILVAFSTKEFSIISLVGQWFSTLWFLWCVLFCSSLMIIINKVFCRYNIYIYIFIWLFSFFIPEIIGLCRYFCFTYPFFIIGYYINKYRVFENIFTKSLISVVIISGIIYSICFLFFSRETYIYTSGYCILLSGRLDLHQAVVDLHRTLTGIFGSLFIITSFKLLSNLLKERFSSVKQLLCYFGTNTMQLYVISTLLIWRYITFKLAGNNTDVDYVIAFLTFVTFTILFCVIVEILKKFKITNLLFFGKI